MDESRRFEKEAFLQLVKKFYSFYGKRSFHSNKSPPRTHVLSHSNLVHALPTAVFKIHFNIILPSTPRASKWSFPFRFRHQCSLRACLPPICITSPSHLILLNFITQL